LMARNNVNNVIWGVVLVLAGFVIAVVGLRFVYPTSLIIDLIGLGITLFGYVVFRSSIGTRRRMRTRE